MSSSCTTTTTQNATGQLVTTVCTPSSHTSGLSTAVAIVLLVVAISLVLYVAILIAQSIDTWWIKRKGIKAISEASAAKAWASTHHDIGQP